MTNFTVMKFVYVCAAEGEGLKESKKKARRLQPFGRAPVRRQPA